MMQLKHFHKESLISLTLFRISFHRLSSPLSGHVCSIRLPAKIYLDQHVGHNIKMKLPSLLS
jgi:hypothetical protein